MSIRSHTRMKLHVRNCEASSSCPHVLAGIQAEFGLDPRLKHSGVTALKRFSLLVRMQRHFN
jgi:hypothetical protein